MRPLGTLAGLYAGLIAHAATRELLKEHRHERVAVLEHLLDAREHRHHGLAALGEPLREERVRVDLQQYAALVPGAFPA